MTPVSLDISVVICAYSEARWNELVASVGSVRQQTHAPVEIIVVVDHNPRLLERARATFDRVIAIENQEARGVSGARNSGVAQAKGDIIAFLDDDAMAAPDWLEQLLTAYRDTQIVGVGGSAEPIWVDGRPAWFPEEFDWVIGCSYRGMPKSAVPVRNLFGCNMSIRRKVFEDIGGFRSDLGRLGTTPVGCEETELCIRIRQHAPERVLIYEPRARVHQKVPASRATWTYFRARCYAEGISKAWLANLVGATDALSSEQSYALRTLPAGILSNLKRTVADRDGWGTARAGAIVLGLGVTTLGYLMGRYSNRSVFEETRPRGQSRLES